MPTPSKECITIQDIMEESPSKRIKLSTPDMSIHEDNDSSSIEVIDLLDTEEQQPSQDQPKSERQKLAQAKKEEERKLRELKKEEERKAKEIAKEEERKAREEAKEAERKAKEAAKEAEKRAREEAKAAEKKRKEEARELEKKQREEAKETERKKREELKEMERKKKEAAKEAERKRKEELKEAERKAKEEAKEAERKAKEAKEAEKQAVELKKKKLADKQKIGNFFSRAKSDTSKDSNSAQTLFDKLVLPFHVKSNCTMAASGQLPKDKLAQAKASFENLLTQPAINDKSFFKSRTMNITSTTVVSPEDIVQAMENNTSSSTIFSMLRNLGTIKYLQFYENEKPPYIGTWCSKDHISLNFPITEPFNQELTGYDYTYDSDLDWREEEGDDIDIDEDDEEEEDEDNDMEDFVEAEMERETRFVGKLKPTFMLNDGTNKEVFNNLKFERLHITVDFPIDPKINYWKAENDDTSLLSTPLPATTSTPVNVLTPTKPTIKDEKIITSLITFIEANNDFSIGTLVELSQKQFKDFTKVLLKNTIQEIAHYNKKTAHWEIKPQFKQPI
ncbi:chromatin assembly factor 1 subunit p90 [[Candida] jaroonii]|uniref:Chromatin assembly factor 1 subunit p90 n=1 Tax=[Candida] jaroonii TaxID=467808 RepID=A0ACA9YE50_9ASCO|nr:chromatin assembly factor 1 subunit p90 [[Candida] jaroonii]